MNKLRRVKNLCSLGIDRGSLIPFLLPEIRSVVPSYSGTFLWLDKTYNFINVYDESPYSPSITNRFVNNYLDSRDREARRSLSEWLRESVAPEIIASTDQLAYRQFYQSDYYHEILKPLGYHHSLYLGLKVRSDPVGILALHRRQGERLFSQSDKNHFLEMSRMLAQALSLKVFYHNVLPSKREVGLLILDERGELQHANPQGGKLMFLATNSEVKKSLLASVGCGWAIPEEIKALVQKLCKEFSDQPLPHQAPQWETRNFWGCFVLQASWFKKPENEENGLIAITVQCQEPILIQVMLRCDELGFTERQTQVAIAMLKGLSCNAVADNLHVSPNTVKDHTKKIYERLNICGKSELFPSLLSMY